MSEEMRENAAMQALGLLPSSEAERLRMVCATDAELQSEADAFAAVANELALEPLAVAPRFTLRNELMARIADTPQDAAPTKVAAKPSMASPFTTPSAIAAERFDEGKWEQLAPHVFGKVLFQDPVSQAVTSLVKLEPGGYLPRHRHTGLEQTLVVTGDCIVNGQTYYPGDFRFCLADTEDTEVTTEFGTTILLIAPAQCEILDAAWAS